MTSNALVREINGLPASSIVALRGYSSEEGVFRTRSNFAYWAIDNHDPSWRTWQDAWTSYTGQVCNS